MCHHCACHIVWQTFQSNLHSKKLGDEQLNAWAPSLEASIKLTVEAIKYFKVQAFLMIIWAVGCWPLATA